MRFVQFLFFRHTLAQTVSNIIVNSIFFLISIPPKNELYRAFLYNSFLIPYGITVPDIFNALDDELALSFFPLIRILSPW